MSTASEPTQVWDAERIADRFGPIDLRRICMDPPPGLGTEADVTWFDDHEDRLYELVDGVLVEKTMGYYESMLGVEIARLIGNFVRPRKLGIVLGADGTLKLAPRLVRIPDVSFITKEKFSDGKLPREPIPALAPDLAVEVLSESNTKKEMVGKLQDYFRAGTRLVWYVDPEDRSVRVFTGPDQGTRLSENDNLDGADVLPGFSLSIRELFCELP
jgi:Uma2 family endonuclease